MKHPRPITIVLLIATLLAACGTRGTLVLPPGPPTPPVLGGKPGPVEPVRDVSTQPEIPR